APTTFGNGTAGSLPCVIRAFKSECTKQIHIGLPNIPVWQRNYYEHIIRTKTALNKIKKYIQTNPQMWDQDQNNPLIPII
ncbi:MAG: transposase, partial [Patescibacteria group bacterium]|nr:transposase [Patescibacteria group bacterium]